jgi:hypoxanthine phosphoribosyltransferase
MNPENGSRMVESHAPHRAEQPLKRILGWDDISFEVDQLVSVLRDDYDVMLVITRGGMIPACLISERLNIRNILVAAVQFYTGIGETLESPIFLQFPNDTLLTGKSVLVVDDVWDSGRTAMSVMERARVAGAEAELAVLHYKPRASKFPDARPDYFAEITDDWIVYPWDDER